MTSYDEDKRVQNFLFLEANLMDGHFYQEWMDLFADECLYWIPLNKPEYDPSKHVSILHADRLGLENTVTRLIEGKAFAQHPPSDLRRLVSNIELERTEKGVEVAANFLITELRDRTQRVHAGRSEYLLIDEAEGFKIKRKKVLMLGMNAPQENLTFLI